MLALELALRADVAFPATTRPPFAPAPARGRAPVDRVVVVRGTILDDSSAPDSEPCAISARVSSLDEVCRRSARASQAGPTVMLVATAHAANCDEVKLRSEEGSGRSGRAGQTTGRPHSFQTKKIDLLYMKKHDRFISYFVLGQPRK